MKLIKVYASVFLLTLIFAKSVHAATDFAFTGTPIVTDGDGSSSGSVGTTARWSNIGTINGTVLDLEIEIIQNNLSGESDSVTFETDGDDAAVFLRGSTNQTVNLSYNFFETGSSTPVVVIPTGLFQDLDTIESLSILSAQVANYTLEGNPGNPTDLAVSTNDQGTGGDPSDDTLDVTSGANGSSGDTNIAIQLDMQPTASFTLDLTKGNTSGRRRYSFNGNAVAFFTVEDNTQLDTTPPAVPTLDGAPVSTDDVKPVLTGTAEAYTEITIIVGGATFEVVAIGDNTWSLDLNSVTPIGGVYNPVTDGSSPNEIQITSTDAAGNSTNDATSDELTITSIITIDAPVIAFEGNETSYPVSGVCVTASGNVTVSIDGSGAPPPVQSAVSCVSSAWSTTFDVSGINDGSDAFTIDASQVDGGMNVIDAKTVLVDKDTVDPVITISNDGSGGDDIYNATESASVIPSGTTDAPDGSTVTLTFSDGSNPDVVTTANVTGGLWTATAADISSLDDGSISLSADVDDAAGNTGTDLDTTSKDTIGPSIAVNDNGSGGDDFYNAFEDGSVVVSGTASGADGATVTVTFH